MRDRVISCLQYRHLIHAPVNRTSASAWLYKIPWITCQKDMPSTSMTHVACESKLSSVVRSTEASILRRMGCNRACGRIFSAGIKCRYCRSARNIGNPNNIILVSRASGNYLDTQTLKNHPSKPAKIFWNEFIKMSILSIKFNIFHLNVIPMAL